MITDNIKTKVFKTTKWVCPYCLREYGNKTSANLCLFLCEKRIAKG